MQKTPTDKYSYPDQNPLTLFFRNRQQEASFRLSHAKKTLTQTRFALLLAATLYLIYSILDVYLLAEQQFSVLLIRFGIGLPVFLTGYALTFHRYFKKHLQTMVMAIIIVAGLSIMAITLLYGEGNSDIFLTGTLIPIFWAFLFSGLYFVNAFATGVLLITGYLLSAIWFGTFPPATLVSYAFFLVTSLLIGTVGGYTIERYYRSDFVKNRIIDESRRDNERLLLNILPKSIADELKRQPGTIAKNFERITILFADIVNFTQLSSKMEARQVVALLNDVFSRFDELTDKYRLEKIKTIGDAYMVTGGLQQSGPESVHNVARYAFAIQETLHDFTRNTPQPLELRIGIHTGPAVAGVIGVKRFVYDVWGDSVNIASRMESSSEPGKIQVSQDTYELLKNDFVFENRGRLAIKGKGDMQVYYLIGEKDASVTIPDSTVGAKLA